MLLHAFSFVDFVSSTRSTLEFWINAHTHAHSHRQQLSHECIANWFAKHNETKYSKVLRMHFFSLLLLLHHFYVLFNGSMRRRCKGNECSEIFYHDFSSIGFALSGTDAKRAAPGQKCLVSGWKKRKKYDFAFVMIYSPFKSFVNCDRVDMIAFFSFYFGCGFSGCFIILLAPANVCDQYFCFYFYFTLVPCSQFLTCSLLSFLFFGTNTRAHLADDDATTTLLHEHFTCTQRNSIPNFFRSNFISNSCGFLNFYLSSHRTSMLRSEILTNLSITNERKTAKIKKTKHKIHSRFSPNSCDCVDEILVLLSILVSNFVLWWWLCVCACRWIRVRI